MINLIKTIFSNKSVNNKSNNNIKNNFAFMAFKANKVEAAPEYKNYIGWAQTKVLAVNPTMEERNKLLGITSEKIPEYTDTDNEGVKYARITFYVQPLYEDGTPVGPIVDATFFIRDAYRYNRDKTKVQVIDKYGYSGWATQEECKNHSQLKSTAGNNLRISTDYRPAYTGEIALIEFIKTYLNIDEYITYENKAWVVNKKNNPEDCECEVEVKNFFTGNFNEIKDIPKLMPENTLKMVFGIRKVEDKVYQTVYTNTVAKANSRNVNNIIKDITERKSNGGLSNQEYDGEYIHEYTVTPTNLEVPTNNPFPAPTASTNNPWFKE